MKPDLKALIFGSGAATTDEPGLFFNLFQGGTYINVGLIGGL
ncbi:hypothetical protein ACM0P6_04835 [Komagataeibacter sucrofermentans]|nr:hypothetical protein [Komagataeibacter sucrofermentans]